MKKKIKIILLLLCVSAIQPVFAQSKLLTTLSDIFTLAFNKNLVLYPHIEVKHFMIKAHEFWQKDPIVTLDDLLDKEAARQEFESIIDYMLNSEKYVEPASEPIRYLLLTGQPRSGKTFSVTCLAGSMKHALKKNGKMEVGYFKVTPEDCIRCGGIENILAAINHNRHSVVFMDNLDMININKSIAADYIKIVADFNQKNGNKIFLIVATNDQKKIDTALKSIGKLGKHIQLN